METDIWTIISSLATAFGFFIISVSAIVALNQFIEMNKSRTLEAFIRALDELSTSEASEARRFVYSNNLPPIEDIKPGTEVYARLYKVYVPFDKVGLMISKKLISEDIDFEMYGESIIIIWKKLNSFIYAERKRMARERYQMYFEKLYYDSIKYLKKHYPQETELLLKTYSEIDSIPTEKENK